MTDQMPRMLRADAQYNRDLLLEAARSLFSERGLDITMREVARGAGVGPATLYRRFATKQALIDAAFADELHQCRAIVEEGSADADPWRGFCAAIERLTVLNSRNRGFVDAFLASGPDLDAFASHRAALLRQLVDLTERARSAGRLRADFVIDDLLLVLLAGRALSSTPPERREVAARRFAALAIDSFRASSEHGVLPAPPRLVTSALRP